MDIPKDYINKFRAANLRTVEEYQSLVNQGRKLLGCGYYALHRRIENGFSGDRSLEFVVSNLKTWLHKSDKSNDPGLCFNYEFKKYRDTYPQKKLQEEVK